MEAMENVGQDLSVQGLQFRALSVEGAVWKVPDREQIGLCRRRMKSVASG